MGIIGGWIEPGFDALSEGRLPEVNVFTVEQGSKFGNPKY